MIISSQVEVLLNPQNKQYYLSLGYDLESLERKDKRGRKSIPLGTKIFVKIKDLPSQSNVKIDLRCDYCGNMFQRKYSGYISLLKKSIIKKDCCIKCRKLKVAESNVLKYGVSNTTKLKQVRDKIEETCLRKYGTKDIGKVEKIKNKRKTTNFLKYGSNTPSKNKEVQQKIKNTMIKKYGVPYAMQNKDICERQRKSANITWCKNSKVPTSIQQLYLCNLLNGICNVPCDQFVIDIVLNNIAIEYDGGVDIDYLYLQNK